MNRLWAAAALCMSQSFAQVDKKMIIKKKNKEAGGAEASAGAATQPVAPPDLSPPLEPQLFAPHPITNPQALLRDHVGRTPSPAVVQPPAEDARVSESRNRQRLARRLRRRSMRNLRLIRSKRDASFYKRLAGPTPTASARTPVPGRLMRMAINKETASYTPSVHSTSSSASRATSKSVYSAAASVSPPASPETRTNSPILPNLQAARPQTPPDALKALVKHHKSRGHSRYHAPVAAQANKIRPLTKADKNVAVILKRHRTPGDENRRGSQHSLSKGGVTSLLNTRKLIRDGRRTPDQFKSHARQAATPSEMSLKSITEYYNIPDGNFTSAEDVFRYRGYKKLNKIDEGAFGIVSKALRLADKQVVAVKEVDLRRKRAKRIEEMKRELFVLQKIDSDNVVRLIEHFIIGQMLVIVMEFCAGSNLTAYLKETSIDEQEAVGLFKQMAASIKVLHRKCIAHRDVKLNNFLLDSTRKVVKIGDFGLSVVSFRPPQGILMAKTYCGTEPYMAPEILRRNSMGFRSYNPLYADIWSLGVCLFAMLTRTFPFKMHASQQGMLKAQAARKWRFPRSLRDTLSEELKDLVWHMLDPVAERRININGVVAHPWLNAGQVLVLSHDEAEPTASS